jgi:hypothetical protein
MGFVNEAVFYLTFLPAEITRFVVMTKAEHKSRNERLADYYHRTYRHLLRDISIIEVDIVNKTLRNIGDK